MKHLVSVKQLNRNQFFLIGFAVGLILTICLPDAWEMNELDCGETLAREMAKPLTREDDFEPRLNLINKPMTAKKAVKNIIRPRYYSSELGIREKIFVGVMTTQKHINTLATAFNRTTAHHVDKIKYFINAADNVRNNFKLKNIVGFTDARDHLKPFHILKYIADNYLDDYDFFYLTMDTTYVNARRLLDKLNHISIGFDVYVGQNPDASQLLVDDERARPADVANEYCDLSAGIIFSSSLIRKIRANLDWCVRNAASNSDSLNIGRCVKYASKIANCQQSFQVSRGLLPLFGGVLDSTALKLPAILTHFRSHRRESTSTCTRCTISKCTETCIFCATISCSTTRPFCTRSTCPKTSTYYIRISRR